jgi:DNA-binding MarR family transcriptional regulator
VADLPSVVLGVQRAAHRVEAYAQRLESTLGVTRAEAQALASVAARRRCAVADVGQALGLRPSTLTSVLDRLADRGLVRRETHPADRRSFLVALTPKGAALARRAAALLDELDGRVADGVTERDLSGFWAVLDALETAAGTGGSG